ncbi:MAG: D-glycerate dehydrogenase [Patescibacteria group bacterium]
MPHIFVTRPIPDAGLKLLRSKKCVVDVYPHDQPIPRGELLKRLKAKKYDGLISILTDRIDATVLKAAGPQLKVIANYAVGFDNIDVEAARHHGVTITNTPGPEISESVAEHTIALLFALTHRIVEADQFARDGRYKSWGPQQLLGTDVIGKTIGLVGMGRIGQALARRLYDGFGVKIVYTNQTRDVGVEHRERARRLTLPLLLKTADIVSLHVPLTAQTHHLISIRELKIMKPTAFLINTSRGPVVDEAALINALKKKQIAGAALDVFEHEPKIPPALKRMQNVVLTPHTASATVETRQTMSRRAAENILAVLAGHPPKNPIQ